MRTVRPSPARVAAPEPEVWLPITDLGEVLELEVELWASELLEERADPTLGGGSPSGNVTLLPAPVEPVPAPQPEIARGSAPAPVALRPASVPTLPAPATRPFPAPAPSPAPAVQPAPGPAPTPSPAPAPAGPRRRTHPQTPTRPGVGQAVVLTATAAAVAVGAMFMLGAKQHQVTVEVDGRPFVRSTDAATVGDLLRAQHLVLGPHDVVAPGLGARVHDGLLVEVVHDAVSDAPPPQPGVRAPHLGKSAPVAPAAPLPPAPAPPPVSPATALTAAAPPTTPSTVHESVASTVTPGRHHARGGASWYASPFGSDSCASRSLPKGTVVSIVNLDNGRRASCRVADYGPVARSRVLDLDNDVFRRLSPLGIGVIHVAISW